MQEERVLVVTIHELANLTKAKKIDLPFNLAGTWLQLSPAKSDILVTQDNALVIGINRETGVFAAQRGSFIVTGRDDDELLEKMVDGLTGERAG